MKYIITESQYNKVIDKFISRQFKGFEEKTNPKYDDSTFWVKNGEIIAEIQYDEIHNHDYFWIDGGIWDIISGMFSLEYGETQQVISLWMEKHYSLGKLRPEAAKSSYRDLRWRYNNHYFEMIENQNN
jgi:hypothetical protein